MTLMKHPKRIHLVVRPDGELVLIVRRKDARSYGRHYHARVYRFHWSKADQQYGAAKSVSTAKKRRG